MGIIKDLKEYDRKDKKEIQVVQQMFRRSALILAYSLRKTFFTPNSVTLMGIPFAAFTAMLFYYGYFWQGALLANFTLLLDYVDGALARMKQQFSKMAPWFEPLVDRIVDAFVYIGFGVGLYNFYQDYRILVVTLVIVAVRYLTAIVNDHLNFREQFKTVRKGYQVRYTFFKNNNFLTFVIKQVIYTRVNIYLLILLSTLINLKLEIWVLIMVYHLLFYLAYVLYFTFKLPKIVNKN